MKERDDIVVMSAPQREVYETLKKIGPTTDMDLTTTMREEGVEISDSGLRHRRVRLMEKGYIVKTKAVVNKPGGRPLTVWRAK